jgi:hypothetical protein
MRPLIMDARALLEEYASYAPLFAFYQNGIKDLIQEAVVTRSFNSPFTTQYHLGLRYPKGLAQKVMTDFEFALDNHHNLFGEESSIALYNLEFAQNNLDAIRMVAEMVEEEVDKFLQQHLRTRLFEIAQEDSDAQFLPRWSGRDLLIFIRTLSEKERSIWLPSPDW